MDIDVVKAKYTLGNKLKLENGDSIDTHYALKIMEKGLPLFLEKPISTTFEDLGALYKAYLKYPEMNEKIVVSFPLRLSPIVDIA